MTDYYEHPEKLNLIKIAELEDGGGYDWDVFVVYQHTTTGYFYSYEDSGCSCNGPVFYSLQDLTKIPDPESFADSIMDDKSIPYSYSDKVKFVWKVKDAIRKSK